ncbi:type II toxin-antitoxin system VapC family toxin [Pseudonocardia sp. NPDC046786]|uniref:type II toxin-antitoxin system VapC family toxin n=1 Tax=Pseudonocardia sp. NPDC046786 TaxID=3155471 RepID=UPI0033EFF11B
MPSYVVVDTDVFSYIWQNRAEAAPYERYIKGKIPVLSFTSAAELYYGASYKGWGERKVRELEASLKSYLIAPYTPQMAKLWGSLKATARATGHPLGVSEHSNDLWIATMAIFHDAPLLSHNRRHFHDLPGLDLVSPRPWE